MKKHLYALSLTAFLAVPLMAQDTAEQADASPSVEAPKVYPSPNAIVDAAPASEWTAIAPSDLMVMDLEADRNGKERRVIIQLMPEPFSQGWIRNIRKLADAKFWDGTAIIRVQDNYVTQWGDPNGGEEGAKPLPDGLEVVDESDYSFSNLVAQKPQWTAKKMALPAKSPINDVYAGKAGFWGGWPFAFSKYNEQSPIAIFKNGKTLTPEPSDINQYWPVHCYGMVGVGRNLSPDTGDGSSLYTVIGHAPRHLDRNIALVGRIISGMEHMSSLARGTGDLGFYETPEEGTKIISVRMGNQVSDVPSFEYLSTEGATFAKYADARANRRDPFFNVPAGGADICNIPVPIRKS